VNEYEAFIQNRRLNPPNTKEYLEIHHIIPKFAGGSDDPENLIPLSYPDHVEAHKLYSLCYPSVKANFCFLMMSSQTREARRSFRVAGAYATHIIAKSKKVGFFNSEQQKKNAATSLASSDAREIRRKAGQIGGVIVKQNIAIKPIDKFIFSYQNQEVLCFFNCSIGTEVLNDLKKYQLQTFGEELNMIRVSPLLTGKRSSAYGWTCKKIIE